MSVITLDTHKFVRKLQEAGFNQAQADGLTEAMRAAIDETERVTRKDLQIELAPVHTELKLLKWMSTTNIALSVFLVGLVGKALHLW